MWKEGLADGPPKSDEGQSQDHGDETQTKEEEAFEQPVKEAKGDENIKDEEDELLDTQIE